jgi:citrate lyase subunit beta/citryl-CoA lyase
MSIPTPGDTPLTYLFVPGNRPERFAKAIDSGADRIILDLEDAVAPEGKAAARSAIAEWTQGNRDLAGKVLIRINDAATAWHADDLALASAVQAQCIMLPKCEAAHQVVAVMARLPRQASVLPLIETARGLVAVHDISSATGVARLAFGSLDYMVDLDIGPGSLALDFAATQIAVASRAAGLPSPVAGVTPNIDATKVSADMLHAKSLGFGAKMCIHPAQLAAVRAALAPTAAELAWAQRVLQAWATSNGGAIQLDGKMVDRPVVLKAERILSLASQNKS